TAGRTVSAFGRHRRRTSRTLDAARRDGHRRRRLTGVSRADKVHLNAPKPPSAMDKRYDENVFIGDLIDERVTWSYYGAGVRLRLWICLSGFESLPFSSRIFHLGCVLFRPHARNDLTAMAPVCLKVGIGRKQYRGIDRFGHANKSCIGEAGRYIRILLHEFQ